MCIFGLSLGLAQPLGGLVSGLLGASTGVGVCLGFAKRHYFAAIVVAGFVAAGLVSVLIAVESWSLQPLSRLFAIGIQAGILGIGGAVVGTATRSAEPGEDDEDDESKDDN